MSAPETMIRLDKWLWHARFFKTRSLAAKQVSEGRVRVNGNHVKKPAQSVGPGDVLTFPQARQIRVVRIVVTGHRRGPASEAQTLFEDLSPPEPSAPRPDRVGDRPTKKARRAIDALRDPE